MDVDSVDSVEGSADFFDSDDITSTLDKPLWFGREVQLSTEKNQKLQLLAQFFFANLERMEEILNLQSGEHCFHLIDFQEEILEEISSNLDHYTDFVYSIALHHPLNRNFTVIDPKNYQTDIVHCKNFVKSGVKFLGKGAKKLAKVGKKVGKGAANLGKDIAHGAKSVARYVKEHPVGVTVGVVAFGVGLGVGYYTLSSLAQATGVAIAGAGAAAQGTGRRSEDEDGPNLSDPIAILPPKDPAPLSSFLSDQEKAHIEKSNPFSGLTAGLSTIPNIPPLNTTTQFQNGISSTEFLKRNTEGKSNQPINEMTPKFNAPFKDPSLPQSAGLQGAISGFLQTAGKGISKQIPNPIQGVKDGIRGAKLLLGSTRSCHIETEGIKYSNLRIGFINGMDTTLEEALSHLEHIRQFTGGMCVEGVYNHSNTAFIDGLEILALSYGGSAPVTSSLLLENWTRFHEENINNPDAKYLQFAHSMGAILTRDALAEAPQEIRDRIIVISIGPAVVIPKELCYESIPYAGKNDVVHLGENIFAYIVSGAFSNDDQKSMERYAELVKGKQELVLLEQHPQSEGMGHSFQDPTFYKPIEDHVVNYLNSGGQDR